MILRKTMPMLNEVKHLKNFGEMLHFVQHDSMWRGDQRSDVDQKENPYAARLLIGVASDAGTWWLLPAARRPPTAAKA